MRSYLNAYDVQLLNKSIPSFDIVLNFYLQQDMLPHHSTVPPMTIATFPDDFGAPAACIQPSAPSASLAGEGHRHHHHQQQQIVLGAEALHGLTGKPGPISELAGLQNELEGIQAGIHQVRTFIQLPKPASQLTYKLTEVSITVWSISTVTGLYLTKQVTLFPIQH